ncbi:hypothetical protein HM1_0495 [Heliomicrobium modesticaldum Ice1]|uniref:Uncharacterized protein n=1 Tax=Heliobacterium modesticaldum (strain ATCC 51547 / Ice1) TaxID=498761 RepID=B0TFL0_HELMI|nr:hypothetical protein HM1_0495 [Heliomicrobium modesticaldum Ice1]
MLPLAQIGGKIGYHQHRQFTGTKKAGKQRRKQKSRLMRKKYAGGGFFIVMGSTGHRV